MSSAADQERITETVRELREAADWLDDPDLGLTVDQKLAIVRRLLKISEVLCP